MPLIGMLTLKTDLLEGGMPEPQAAAIARALVHAGAIGRQGEPGSAAGRLQGAKRESKPDPRLQHAAGARRAGGCSLQSRGRADARRGPTGLPNIPYCR